MEKSLAIGKENTSMVFKNYFLLQFLILLFLLDLCTIGYYILLNVALN